ncbi:AI-2E family transporter [Microbacterium indicum]|uniref:AI-2E family transporter n=1 Tax=Microbacterium indicum TaxID=358100 RepID=UPI0004215FA7|nr:AI-2E family transporter [Microbacterium indicum]
MASERTEKSSFPPALRILLILAATVIVLAGVYVVRGIVGPVALAAVIVIICYPIGPALERRGAPRWVSGTAVVLLAYLVLAFLALLLVFAISEFVRLIQGLVPDFQNLTNEVLTWLDTLGVGATIGDQVTQIFSVSNIVSVVSSVSGDALSAGTAFFFVLAYVIFMSFDAGRYAGAEKAFGSRIRSFVDRIGAYSQSVRRYFVVNASFGLIVAAVDGVALWFLHVPGALVWAILSFVTNFIPNIGFVLGLVPPAILALVTNDWVTALIVVAIYCVANVTLQVLIQPKFVSDAVGLTLTLSFLSVIFWTFIIGPLGAILSIPLTLFVRALALETDPDARWMRWLSGDDGVLDEKPPAA